MMKTSELTPLLSLSRNENLIGAIYKRPSTSQKDRRNPDGSRRKDQASSQHGSGPFSLFTICSLPNSKVAHQYNAILRILVLYDFEAVTSIWYMAIQVLTNGEIDVV